ncbi:hypothetical protein DSM02_2129 [Leeuwenhoekiella polynyae]|uniref:Uncharacterized protein n=1 Tax=Leeuwenhoekiella polynyae TaxID=1550906 RepID=A0A4Q0P3Y2_9FLAO|nr:hypothetical protein DSM02_2129 [Leeuwenhoekiella polynyae]
MTWNLSGQNTVVEEFINQIIKLEAPGNYNYYCLAPQSRTQGEDGQAIDWRDYNLENIRYLTEGESISGPETIKKVYFLKYNTPETEYDSIVKNKKPNTLYVRKRWYWGKKRVWKEVVKAWKIDKNRHIEEQVFYSISKPIFSDNGTYARISIFKQKRCSGIGFTALYKNEDGTWIKDMEYDHINTKTVMTDSYCGEILVSYKN